MSSLPKLEIRSNRLCSPVKEGRTERRRKRDSPEVRQSLDTGSDNEPEDEPVKSHVSPLRSPQRSPGQRSQKSHPLHIVESDLQRLSIGSPAPRLPAEDDGIYTPRRGSNCPTIKVDIVERKRADRRISPSSSLLSSRSGSDLYAQSNLQQSRSENDLRGTGYKPYNYSCKGTSLHDTSPGGSMSSSGALSARGEGLLTARGPHPSEALCSPMVNRRPVRLLPLRHSSANSLQGE